MAGYIFSIAQDKWVCFCENSLHYGYFTPFTPSISEEEMGLQKTPKRKALNKILAATFGDFVSMKPGDNVYFLSNRKLFGIGVAVRIGPDCKYDNYANASALLPNCSITPDRFLTTNNTEARWVCLFEPSPYFFMKGADMDDVLRFRPYAFKSLRAFEGLTFIKIDDEENQALKEYISLINEPSYDNIEQNIFVFDDSIHQQLRAEDLTEYVMDLKKSLNYPENREFVVSEMLIESLLIQSIITSQTDTFGRWDYLSHQLIASPFKPLKYIDRIDIFGYRYSEKYDGSPKLITKFLLVELKKGPINNAALEQTMQYVDWVCTEYASGDYSRIEAYVVGERAARGINKAIENACQRSFILETHPVKPVKWNNLKVVSYNLNDGVSFEIVSL